MSGETFPCHIQPSAKHQSFCLLNTNFLPPDAVSKKRDGASLRVTTSSLFLPWLSSSQSVQIKGNTHTRERCVAVRQESITRVQLYGTHDPQPTHTGETEPAAQFQ